MAGVGIIAAILLVILHTVLHAIAAIKRVVGQHEVARYIEQPAQAYYELADEMARMRHTVNGLKVNELGCSGCNRNGRCNGRACHRRQD